MDSKINVLLPIAGYGSRFSDVGYELPKPLIDAGGLTILQKALESLDIQECKLNFLVRKEHIHKYAIDEFIFEQYGEASRVIVVEEDTDGAVCTCLLAEEYIDNDKPLVIFTPDCYFEPMVRPLEIDDKYDGMVVVFESDNPAHSYVVLDEDGYVIRAAEKDVISKNAVGGLYYYKKGSDFVRNAKRMVERNQKIKGEYYICPVFNLLLEEYDAKIGIDVNSRHVVLGTPEGLESYLKGEQ